MNIPLIIKYAASLPAIYKQMGGRVIDSVGEVTKSRNSTPQAIKQLYSRVAIPMGKVIDRVTLKKLRDANKNLRTVTENEYWLWYNRTHGNDEGKNLNTLINMANAKASELPPGQAKRLDDLRTFLNDKKKTDIVYRDFYTQLGINQKDGMNHLQSIHNASNGNPVPPEITDAMMDFNDATKKSLKDLKYLPAAIIAPLIGAGVYRYSRYARDKKNSGDDPDTQPGWGHMQYIAKEIRDAAPHDVKQEVLDKHKAKIMGSAALGGAAYAALPLLFTGGSKSKIKLTYGSYGPYLLGLAGALRHGKASKDAVLEKYLPDSVYEKYDVKKHSPYYYSISPKAMRRFG